MDLLFITLGKLLIYMYIRKSKDPRIELCRTQCLTLAQLEREEMFIFSLETDTLIFVMRVGFI